MNDTNERQKSVTLADARERTPAPPGAIAERMKQAALGAVSAEDVAAILAKQVEKAKAGDAAAAKFVLGFVAATPTPVVEKVVEKVKIIERGRRRKKPSEPARVVDAGQPDPPAPVAVDSPSVEQLRTMVGLYLALNHNAQIRELEQALGIPATQLKAVLNCEFFVCTAGRYGLSPAGNQKWK